MLGDQEKVPTLDDKKQTEEVKVGESAFSTYVKENNPIIGENSSIIDAKSLNFLPSSELVFEITYLEDVASQKSAIAYTKVEPSFSLNGSVSINEAFGCLILKETVLGKEVVERKCRKPLEKDEFIVDCKSGILVKAVEPQPWMSQAEIETKADFDRAVLETFRIVQETVKKELHEQVIRQAQIQAELEKQATLQHNNSHINNNAPVHNPTYNLRPSDEGYNPNNDPSRRGQGMPVNNQELEGL